MWFLWLALLAALPHQQPLNPAALKPYEDPEAYEVYAVALPPRARWNLNSEYLVIQQETFPEGCGIALDSCIKGGEAFKRYWGEVLGDFKMQNGSVRFLSKPIPGPVKHKYVSHEQVLAIFSRGSRDPWTEFYRRYPKAGGSVSLSAVGFNAAKTKALVFVGHSYNLLGAIDRYVFLERQEGKWRVVRPTGVTLCMCGA